MPPHKSEDYKISAVQYYLSKNNNQVQTCAIFLVTESVDKLLGLVLSCAVVVDIYGFLCTFK